MAETMAESVMFSVENPVFASFMVNGALLFLKMMAVVTCTVYYRKTKGVFSNVEDVATIDPSGKKGLTPVMDDTDVERTRRVHMNDMENIFPFLILGLFYITTNPVAATATLVFRTFTVARVLHTIAYIGGVRQPARTLCFMVNLVLNIFMAVCVLRHYM